MVRDELYSNASETVTELSSTEMSTETIPAECAEVLHVIWDIVMVRISQGEPSSDTDAFSFLYPNPLPEMVITCPPALLPLAGLTAVALMT